MKIKTGDIILIRSGKDKGRKGKVIKAFPGEGKVVVEGMNVRTKHVRPKKEGEKGEIIDINRPLQVSNVMLICQSCNKPTKIGHEIKNYKKSRVCKKCKESM